MCPFASLQESAKVQRFEVIGQNAGWLLDYQGKDILQQVTLKHSPMEIELSPVQLDEKLYCVQWNLVTYNRRERNGDRHLITDVENIIRDIHCKL